MLNKKRRWIGRGFFWKLAFLLILVSLVVPTPVTSSGEDETVIELSCDVDACGRDGQQKCAHSERSRTFEISDTPRILTYYKESETSGSGKVSGTLKKSESIVTDFPELSEGFTIEPDRYELKIICERNEGDTTSKARLKITLSLIECPSGWPPPFEVTDYEAEDGSDGCCGDDAEKDYGYVTDDGKYICLSDNKWREFDPTKDEFNIFNIMDPQKKSIFQVVSYCGKFTKWAACDAVNNVKDFGFEQKDIDYSGIGGFTPDGKYDVYTLSEGGVLKDSSVFKECGQGTVTSYGGDGLEGMGTVSGAAVQPIKITEVNIKDYDNDGVEDDPYGDIDNDGIKNKYDLCKTVFSCPSEIVNGECTEVQNQKDIDGDGFGDECDFINDNEATDVCTYYSESGASYNSFVCYEEAGKGMFSECCGCALDKNCIGQGTKRAGEPIYSLMEFNPRDDVIEEKTESINVNYVLKVGLKRDETSYNLPFTDLKIRDWTEFKTFEFYVFFPFQKNLRMEVLTEDGTNILRNTIVLSHSVTGTETGRWHHVVISLDLDTREDIFPWLPAEDMKKITMIRFFVDASKLDTTQKHRDSIGETENYDFVNIFYLDRLFLTKDDNAKNRYCDKTAKWESSVTLGKSVMLQPQICQEQPGYTWTGTKCCKADVVDESDKYYTDNLAACWDGMGIPDDKRVGDIINYKYINDVLFYGGKFHGCNRDSAQYNGQWIGSGKDIDMEIKKETHCTHFKSSAYYCDIDNYWKHITTIKSDPKPDPNTNIEQRKAPYTNLLDYANFEDAAWALENAFIDDSDVKLGEKSLHAVGGSGQRGTSNLAGKYTLSGWVKVKDKSKPAKIQIFEGLMAEGEPILEITKDYEEWGYFAETVDLLASYIVVKLSSQGEAWFDNIQLTEFIEEAEKKPFVNTISKTGCCPDNYCWNGEMCVSPRTRLSEENVFDVNYECKTDGTWEPKEYFKRVIYEGNIENPDDVGYCEENMCFGKPNPTNPQLKLKECVDKGYTIFSDSDDKILASSQDNSFLQYICTGKHEPDKSDNWQDNFNQKILFYQTYYGCSITNADWLNLQYKDSKELKNLFGKNNERNLGLCQLPYNLVNNSGFESWDNSNPVIWKKESGTTLSKETQNVIYGSNSLKLLKGTIYQDIDVTGNKYFTLWYKGDKPKINVKAVKGATEYPVINENKEAAYNTDGWKLYNGTINVNKFRLKITTTEVVYVDNVEMFKEDDVASFEYICTKDGVWNTDVFEEDLTIGNLKDTPKRTPDDDTITLSQGCCPATYCWAGEDNSGCREPLNPDNIPKVDNCFFNQKQDQDYVCNRGAWIKIKKKQGIVSGESFCQNNSMCYNEKTGECVNPGTYVGNDGEEGKGDNYCEPIYKTDDEGEIIKDDNNEPIIIDAKWTSRTKLIALQMLEFAKDNAPYTLFCDEGGSALNLDPGFDFDNNYCVLKYGAGNKVLVGTSINVESNLKSYLVKIINNENYCLGPEAQKEDDQFHQCDNHDVWYNKKMNSVIYSKDGVDLKGIKWWQVFKWLKSLFSIKADITENVEFLNSQKFDRLYLYNSGGDNAKTIQALNSERSKVMFIEYNNFNTEICANITSYTGDKYPCSDEDCICFKEGTKHAVYIKGPKFSRTILKNGKTYSELWQDLTAKLRIK